MIPGFLPALRARRPWIPHLGIFLAFALTAGSDPEDPSVEAELRADFPPEQLCEREDLPTLIELDRSAVDSIGRAFSAHNDEVMQRADQLLRSGGFGDPTRDSSIETARRYVQIRSWNAMFTISNLTEIRGGVATMDGAGHFLPFIEGYYNAAMYPLRHVDVARVGEGAFCLRYRIPDGYDEVFTIGSQKVRVRTQDTKNHRGEKVRVLNREWAMGDGGVLELLFEPEYTGRVRRETIVDRGDLIELVTFYDIEGLYVRKHGTHRLAAMAIWRSVLDGDEVPEQTRIGAAAYFPGIDIDLPWFLPDLGLQDLRDFSYPPPLLADDLFAGPGLIPAWLGVDGAGRFRAWDSQGPRPEVLDRRFPDR